MPTKKKSFQEHLRGILILVSGFSFIFSSAMLIVRLLRTPSPTSQPTPESQSVTEQLKVQEQGYLMVLEREPDNPIALQGLVEIRLQLNDLEGTIAPLEKLVTIYPQDEGIKTLLETIKQDLANQKSTTP